MSTKLRNSVRTTAALRQSIRRSTESIRSIARRYQINPKTVAKWRRRESILDLKTGPKGTGSSTLTLEEQGIIVAVREHLVLALDDCLVALQPLIPHLRRSSLHRCLQRHGISALAGGSRGRSSHSSTAAESFGHFSLRAADIRTPHRRFSLLVAVEHSSRFAFVQLYQQPADTCGAEFLRALIKALPNAVRSVSTQSSAAFQPPTFSNVCFDLGIELQPHARELWNETQLQRINDTICQAVSKRWQDHGLDGLRQQLANVVATYNNTCKLDALNGRTPQEVARENSERAISSAPTRSTQSWDSEPRSAPHPDGRTSSLPANPRMRDPDSTREAILEAARSCLAHDGPDGLSLAEVARIAGVNRGTAYKHFKTREKLIAATADWVSDKLFHAVFGSAQQAANRRVEDVNVAELTDRLANFAMDNPELCRAWLLKVLSSPNPSSDRFWREYQGSTARFAVTDLAQQGIDTEVLSILVLAGAFLWPVWARAHSGGKEDMRPLAHRFAQECLRLSMYGNLRSERYPQIARRLKTQPAIKRGR